MACALCLACLAVSTSWADGDGSGAPLRIGSKRFTESYILGEILRQAVADAAPAEHRQGLGNTAIVFEALKAGEIDVYPEYTGTIAKEIMKRERASLEDMNRFLAQWGIGASVPLGFSNGYGLAMRGDASLIRLGELAGKPSLRFGLSHEFLGRADGWPGLAARYRLPQRPIGLDHGLAYEALAAGQVDVIDIYTTDAKIARHALRVLEDDAGYFPSYDAVLLYRLDLPARYPRAWQRIRALEGKISQPAMIAMNAGAEIEGRSFSDIARRFLQGDAGPQPGHAAPGLLPKLIGDDFWRLCRQHLFLVLLSVTIAAMAGIPLGMLAAFRPGLRQWVMGLVGVLQTIPSLALLAMLIPLLGRIGAVPALVALSLYALLPVVRNTCTGMEQVSPGLRMAALALGMRSRQRLLHIDLPLAMPVILAGIKTAATMSVGTATIAAFIGAGGFGERIATGLALNDNDMLLAGAIPAAVLALAVQGGFELLERRLFRRH
ncbi:ABC transporter permease/substrate-binding protein [Noviherbaspirillum galbum]|uniref:ABC transporter permease subunit n=1 Tax=Noviherbaspirillum galbum TaxID=2709383 RepID=A0A6B3SQM8_9BURK|nr:glycine betaine ABC transporter substrate-binding protein [Noviherbaspirillum galbum]NEX61056.1 ABC transporter permease subunit [Noviherbaspirillum galbum]